MKYLRVTTDNALISIDGLCDEEIHRIIPKGKAAIGGLTMIWKGRMSVMDGEKT